MSAHEPRISVRELADRLARGESLVVLDVREPQERSLAAIPVPSTAVDLFAPMNEIVSRLGEVREACTHGSLVVYCHHGVRSLMVADWLNAQGFRDVRDLVGGIEEWSVSIDPGVPRY